MSPLETEILNKAWREMIHFVEIEGLMLTNENLNQEKVDRCARLLGTGGVPPPVRLADKVVRDGHHRIAAALRMGRTEIRAVG